MSDLEKERLFNAARLAFRDETLGQEHAGGWGEWPTNVQKQVLSLLEGLEFSTVLDLGCGPGNYALLIEGWERYVCVDQSEKWLGLAQERLEGRVEFHRSWIEDFELGERADLVLCVDVFQHHAKPEELAEALARVPCEWLCFNLMVTDKEEREDFFWDEWGKLSEGLTPAEAEAIVESIVEGMPAEVERETELPYGEPLPQLTWKCYLLRRKETDR